jgi:tetratricopeptide (TPR) repeat protein
MKMFYMRCFNAGLVRYISLVAALLACGQPALGHDHTGAATGEVGVFAAQAGSPSKSFIESEPPLWSNLGTLSYRITTANELAQKYFDQGLRLTYAFNHAEAQRAFRMAQKLDPACAMCYWGEALVLGPNINAPMVPEANAPALDVIRKAKKVFHSASDKERALIAALARRYSDDPKANRAALDTAYAKAMGRVRTRFPADAEIAVLYAEALMVLSPWDYWEDSGQRPKGRTAKIIKILERVLAKDPDHPGAIHYYIHMVEASNRPERAVPYAKRLGALMPGAGHLVHMPSHIYYRIGRYLDSLAANRAAIAADEAYLARVPAQGIYPQVYYPHAIHMLLVSAQMAGDGRTAIAAAEKLSRVVSNEATRHIPWVQPIKAAPYFAHAQFSAPETVLTLGNPGDELPYVKAMWHYARGIAHATRGAITEARTELETLASVAKQADFTDLIAGGVPVKEIVRIAQQVLAARIAQAEGDLKTAVLGFEAAVALEDGLPYMEPPYWYYPLRQSLGAIYLLAGEVDRAEAAFHACLARSPNNGWALYGLAEVYKRRGNEQQARSAQRRLAQAWAGDRQALDLARL